MISNKNNQGILPPLLHLRSVDEFTKYLIRIVDRVLVGCQVISAWKHRVPRNIESLMAGKSEKNIEDRLPPHLHRIFACFKKRSEEHRVRHKRRRKCRYRG